MLTVDTWIAEDWNDLFWVRWLWWISRESQPTARCGSMVQISTEKQRLENTPFKGKSKTGNIFLVSRSKDVGSELHPHHTHEYNLYPLAHIPVHFRTQIYLIFLKFPFFNRFFFHLISIEWISLACKQTVPGQNSTCPRKSLRSRKVNFCLNETIFWKINGMSRKIQVISKLVLASYSNTMNRVRYFWVHLLLPCFFYHL